MTPSRQLRLEWAENRGRTCLRVRGWTEAEFRALDGPDAGDPSRRLALLPSAVLAAGGDYRAVPPVAGKFTLERDSVCFVPRFPFVDGVSYSLFIDSGFIDSGAGIANPEVWAIRRPSAPLAPAAEVVAIYPTATELPVNLLRIYVHFSGPMSEGWAGRAVRVCREDTGAVLAGVFLPPEPELWDPSRRRLTMLLDPGRIKRGLVPNREIGYPLVEGAAVRIVVDSEFRDAGGQPLQAGAERSYRVGPALRERIDPGRWRLTTPEAGSVNPLLVEFYRPLDNAMLQHSLRVCDSDGAPLPGHGAPGASEQSWRFTPAAPWPEGHCQLQVEPGLEDIAGNSVLRVFDRDIARTADSPSGGGRVAVGFSCVPAASFVARRVRRM